MDLVLGSGHDILVGDCETTISCIPYYEATRSLTDNTLHDDATSPLHLIGSLFLFRRHSVVEAWQRHIGFFASKCVSQFRALRLIVISDEGKTKASVIFGTTQAG